MIPKISVITVQNRFGGVDITWSALKRQTFKSFEWVFCDTLYEERKEAVKAYTKEDKRVQHIKQRPKDSLARTWLAHAENQGVRQSKGELIVFLQDYIHIRPDALEKFWIQYTSNNKSMITGVGNQYSNPGKEDIANLEGLITIFKEPFEKQPTQICWQDPRMRTDMGSFYECFFQDIEFNYCAIPRKAFEEIGGLDESMDYIGHAWDNVHAAGRMQMVGYTPFIDQSNESFSVNNDAWSKSSAKTPENSAAVSKYCKDSLTKMMNGELPIKLPYLD